MRFLLFFLLSSVTFAEPSNPFFFQFFTSLLPKAPAPKPPKNLPPGLSLSVHQDVTYNNRFVISRLGDIAGSSTVIPIYSTDVPVSDARQTQSKYLSPEMRDFFLVESDGKKFVRVFSREPIRLGPSDAERGIRTGPTLRGAKLTSHATHLVWDPEAPATKRFYVKLTDLEDINPDVVGKSVHMSDFIEENVRGRGDLGHILPERFATTMTIGGKKYGNIAREVAPANLAPEGELLLPAHALLDSKNPLAKSWSEMLGKNWALSEFVPNYGYWLGKLNYEAGIHPEGHAQNVLVRVSPASGKIFGFVLRDMHDTSIDPFVRALRGEQAVSPSLLDMSILNLQHVDTNERSDPRKSSAAGLVAAYHHQVLYGLPGDEQKFEKFYDGYYRAAKEAAPSIANDDPHLESPELWDLEDLPRAIQELQDATMTALARNAAKRWTELPRTEGVNELLKARIKSRQIGLPKWSHYSSVENFPKEQLRFYSDGNHILVMGPKGEPAIMLTDLVQWEKERAGIPKGGFPKVPGPCAGSIAKLAS